MIKEMRELIVKRIKDDYKLILINCSARVNMEQEFIEIIGLKPTCESCKYFDTSLNISTCANPLIKVNTESYLVGVSPDFGCILHERKENDTNN